jgi:hypothetical protein
MKNLENFRKAPGPTCQPQLPLKRLAPVTRARACDTTSGDAAVTARRRCPPPHVVPALSPHRVEQRMVSPTSPSFPCTPATTVLCRSLPPRPHLCQPPSSAARTRRCLPKLCLHPAVLVALTTCALNHFPVLLSPVPLHRRSSTSSPTTNRFGHLPSPSLPP